ncbi:putative short-chain dehydrogenases/reductase [Hypoxylon trugodes]|uniref:putative short-chain dehydrogenases/reductase n=1 Tax=Hypoxylon trugodes TaxID=326681 RepID=UPI00219FA85D|nr:putative short-chain dehydrogenases/reductase [Hypoxylon trugodes]KAI1391657.1 putative short-chain dehydrogenases/reductase [Hypoxylon trugodes]
MVALSKVIASNERIASTLPPSLVAVFVGGTSGVGEYTVKAFAKYASKPKVYLVGRSQESATRIIDECKKLNPGGIFEFIKADVSVLKGVDDVCRQLKSKETEINLLFQSQGSLGFTKITSDGLPQASALNTYSRMRFVYNLLPLIQNASSLRRIVSVLAANCEGPIDLDNLSGLGFALRKWRNQLSSMQTLLLEEAARRAPNVAFVHTMPGLVKSGILRDAEGIVMNILSGLSHYVLEPLLQTPPDESGERHLFVATSAMYASYNDNATPAGVPLDTTLSIARGSDGKTGSGVYSINNYGNKGGEGASPKVEQLLAQFRKDGTARKVCDHVTAEFKRITGTEIAA